MIHTTPPIDNTVFLAALEQVYAGAVAKLPEAQRETLDRAKEIVKSGKVQLVNAHEERVLASDGCTWYATNGSCQCKDAHFRPETPCKHRLAARLVRRIHEVVAAPQAAQTPTRPPLQASRTERARLLAEGYAESELAEIKGAVTIRVMGLVRMTHQRYGIERLDITMTTITESYALAHATLVLKDGRTFSEDGISTPKNVGGGVKEHWQTMALTRSKGRVCRNVLCEQAPSTEEMSE